MRTHTTMIMVSLVMLSMSCDRCGDDGPVDDSVPHSESDSANSDADQDGYSVWEDCDDMNASVHPGATEICDGLDNDCNQQVDDVPSQADDCNGADDDCDGMVDEDEIAVFESDDGDVVDYSTDVLNATASSPWLIAIEESGELRICGGERRHLFLDVSASLAIRPADLSLDTELSVGDAAVTVVDIRGDSSVRVTVDGMTIRDGVSDCEFPKLGGMLGGGICCVGDALLELRDSTLENNVGSRGGGVFSQSCSIVIEDSLIINNEAQYGGGGIFLAGGSLEITGSVLEANESTSGGSAIGMQVYNDGTADVPAFGVMENSVVKNGASSEAVWVGPYSSFECVGELSEEYGIVQNEAQLGAVFLVFASYGFTGTNCDMGSAADGNDNSDADIYGDDGDVIWTADIGNDATFFCSLEQKGCTIE